MSWQQYGACVDHDPELFSRSAMQARPSFNLRQPKPSAPAAGALSLPGMGAPGRNQRRSVGWNERRRTPGVESSEEGIAERPHSPRGWWPAVSRQTQEQRNRGQLGVLRVPSAARRVVRWSCPWPGLHHSAVPI